MPLQLYDLPFDMLEMIGQSYDTARTNTVLYAGGRPCGLPPVVSKHPKRVFCRATRAEYIARIMAKARSSKRGKQ